MVMRSRPSRAAGPAFTLVELVITMSLVAVVAAIAIPRYAASAVRFRADAAARRVVADLARTAQLARLTSTTQTIEFRPGSHSYFIANDRSLTNNSAGSLVDLTDSPYGALMKEADFDGARTVSFNGFGMAGASGHVVLKVGTEQRTIVFDNASGQTTIQNP